MQDQGLDWENVYGCVLTELQHGWLSFGCNRKIKKVAIKNLLSTPCIYRCEHIPAQNMCNNLSFSKNFCILLLLYRI